VDKSRFIIMSVDAAPEAYVKVLEAKKGIEEGMYSGVSEAVKAIGISRSTYYKYCDHVFPLASGALGQRITVSVLLSHESGVLSQFLRTIAEKEGNIVTISQDAPINGMANASITFDISEIQCTFDELIDVLGSSPGVNRMNIVAIE